MARIHILNTEISNKIAAGEVVERPASVIKELVENSIDAGATVITVEIKDGGISYMRVTDNGSGMTCEDAKIALLRHATSKIQSENDLDAIYTLGFRGEALSSVAAVSKVDIFTKTNEAKDGIHVYAEGGEIYPVETAGTPLGTTIIVKNLFYNTPARMKFLKKNSTEGGYISDIMSRFILAHPEISFKFINGSKEQLFSSGNNNIADCVYTIYGRDYAKSVINVDYNHNGVHITGIIGKSEVSRPNRNYQSFFINKRYIKSPLIIRALEEAYKNQIMIGKFPMAAINLDIHPSMIDINVHPTKLEVKFSDEKLIYETVFFGVKNALYSITNIPKIEKKDTKPSSFFDKMKPDDFRQMPINLPQDNKFDKKSTISISDTKSHDSQLKKSLYESTTVDVVDKIDNINDINIFQDIDDLPTPLHKIPKSTSAPLKIAQESANYIVEDNTITNSTEYKIIGQIFDTYIIVEKENEMLIIDQHAAHERIKYEELKVNMNSGKIMKQTLITPVVVSVSAIEYSVYKNNFELFDKIGFETENFGDNSIIVRTKPMSVEEISVSELIIELLSQLESSKQEIITAKAERALYTIACKSAIKANRKVHDSEMKTLLDMVFALENINTCPHGRPIIISMSKKEIEKEFKRIV